MSKELHETPAIVLKCHSYKENDLIITFITEDYGKLSAIARGAKKSKKRFPGGIDIFDCGVISFTSNQSRSNLAILESITSRTAWGKLSNSLKKFALASAMIEVTDIFAPEHDLTTSNLYRLLFYSISEINKSSGNANDYTIWIWFALHCLMDSGFSIDENIYKQPVESQNWIKQISQCNEVPSPPSKETLNNMFHFIKAELESVIERPVKALNDKVLYMSG